MEEVDWNSSLVGTVTTGAVRRAMGDVVHGGVAVVGIPTKVNVKKVFTSRCKKEYKFTIKYSNNDYKHIQRV